MRLMKDKPPLWAGVGAVLLGLALLAVMGAQVLTGKFDPNVMTRLGPAWLATTLGAVCALIFVIVGVVAIRRARR